MKIKLVFHIFCALEKMSNAKNVMTAIDLSPSVTDISNDNNILLLSLTMIFVHQ